MAQDDRGDAAVALLADCGVCTTCVQRDAAAPTGTVGVAFDEAGSPRYTIHPNAAWDRLEWSDELAKLAARADAVYFGTLGQRTGPAAATIARLLEAAPADGVAVARCQSAATVRRPGGAAGLAGPGERAETQPTKNCRSSPPCGGITNGGGITDGGGITGREADVLAALRDRLDLRLVALTRGGDDAAIVGPDGVSESPGVSATVRDTVGAGDAWTAALAVGLLGGQSPETINRHACRVAGFVCEHRGAVPRLPAGLRLPAASAAG